MICQMSLNIMPIYGYECLPASAGPSLMIVGQLDRLRGEKNYTIVNPTHCRTGMRS